MALLIVQHTVREYNQWKPVFDGHQIVREKHGAKRHRLLRQNDDPNSQVVITQFPSVEQAQAFAQDPSLLEAMERAGVQQPVNIWICNEVEDVSY